MINLKKKRRKWIVMKFWGPLRCWTLALNCNYCSWKKVILVAVASVATDFHDLGNSSSYKIMKNYENEVCSALLLLQWRTYQRKTVWRCCPAPHSCQRPSFHHLGKRWNYQILSKRKIIEPSWMCGQFSFPQVHPGIPNSKLFQPWSISKLQCQITNV